MQSRHRGTAVALSLRTKASLHIKLRDASAAIIDALTRRGLNHGDSVVLDIAEGDALAEAAYAIASPANSFGYIDGGFDLALVRHSAGHCRTACRRCVPTENATIPNPVVAPTMRVPRAIADPPSCCSPTRAAVLCATDHGFASLVLLGMGTGVSRLPPAVAARQMIDGIDEAVCPPPFSQSAFRAAGLR